MIEDLKKETALRMQKAVDSLGHALDRLRTGRANVALLEHVRVEYYGQEVPLTQCATAIVEDARTIMISPWDKAMVAVLEKAIYNSDLGLTPNTTGTTIRIVMPPLTEERRRDLVKVVKAETEQARIAIRNIRRDSNQDIKELAKERLVNEDEEKRLEQEIQKLTDQYVSKADSLMAGKERELLSV